MQIVNLKKGQRRVFTPIRAIGVRIGKEIFLFDPLKGKPFPDAGGQGVATLAQLRSKPDQLNDWTAKHDWKPGEIKLWEPFLACPLSGLSSRMAWLEGITSDSSPVKLHWDVLATRDRILKEAGETKCRFWNPTPRIRMI